MQLIWLLLAAAVGFAAASLIWRRIATQRGSALTAQLASAEAAVDGLRAERDSVVGDGAREARRLEQQLMTEAGALKERLAGVQAELAGERRAAGEKLQALQGAQEQMVAVATQSAGAAAAQSGKALLATMEAKLKAATTQADADLAQRQRAVAQTIAPVTDALAEMKATLERVDGDRRSTHSALTEQLKAVTEAQRELRTETGTLSRALRQPHTRGRWGELHLRRLVEVAGMSDRCDFTEQRTIDDDGRILRPDLIAHLPGGKDVVVDAKAPLAPYLEVCEATDEAQRVGHAKRFARGLRSHVRKLASKDYCAQFDASPDFVVMYLPGEHFLSAGCEHDPDLIEDAARLGVLIATPTTLIVLLKTIAHAWQQEVIAAEAQAIATLGQQLYNRLCKYLEHIDLVGKRLNSTVEAHNAAIGSLERMVLPTARKFPSLGAVAADSQLPDPRTISSTARDIQARELPTPTDPTPSDPTPATATPHHGADIGKAA